MLKYSKKKKIIRKKQKKSNKKQRMSNSRKSRKSRAFGKFRYTKKHGGGSNVRHDLVQYHKNGEIEKYQELVMLVRDDLVVRANFFDHLKRNMDTFSETTKRALVNAIHQLQEDAVPESWDVWNNIVVPYNKTN